MFVSFSFGYNFSLYFASSYLLLALHTEIKVNMRNCQSHLIKWLVQIELINLQLVSHANNIIKAYLCVQVQLIRSRCIKRWRIPFSHATAIFVIRNKLQMYIQNKILVSYYTIKYVIFANHSWNSILCAYCLCACLFCALFSIIC